MTSRVAVAGLGALCAASLVACSSSTSAPAKTSPAAVTAAGSAPADSQQVLPATPTGTLTTQEPIRKVADTSGIAGVVAWDTGATPNATVAAGGLSHDHVTGPVKYSITPPVGGPHNAIWMNAGVYTKPIPNERAVHNLEHGAVWITYRANLPAAQVDSLVAFVGKQSLIAETSLQIPGQQNRYVDLSPWVDSSLSSPIVISAWGHQLGVDSADDPRLQKFVDTFRHSQKYTPELGAPVDGVPIQTGGRAAQYGATKPNPPGTAN